MISNGHDRKLEVLNIEDLKVDHNYQRALNQNLVEAILTEWDFMAADAIVVSKREDGSLYIVNGQHRAAAAKLAGETEILAFVYDGLTVAQEADLRLKANNRRSDSSMERFHAQLVKGVKESQEIRELLERYGTHINRQANSNTGVNCVSTVERMYRQSPVVTERTLRALQEAYGEVKGESAVSSVLRGTFWFLLAHEGEYHWRSFVERMENAGIEDLMRKMRSHKAVARGPDWLNYYRALLEMYNHRRPEHTRLELRTKHYNQLDRGSLQRDLAGR